MLIVSAKVVLLFPDNGKPIGLRVYLMSMFTLAYVCHQHMCDLVCYSEALTSSSHMHASVPYWFVFQHFVGSKNIPNIENNRTKMKNTKKTQKTHNFLDPGCCIVSGPWTGPCPGPACMVAVGGLWGLSGPTWAQKHLGQLRAMGRAHGGGQGQANRPASQSG